MARVKACQGDYKGAPKARQGVQMRWARQARSCNGTGQCMLACEGTGHRRLGICVSRPCSLHRAWLSYRLVQHRPASSVGLCCLLQQRLSSLPRAQSCGLLLQIRAAQSPSCILVYCSGGRPRLGIVHIPYFIMVKLYGGKADPASRRPGL